VGGLTKKAREDIATAMLLGCEFFHVPDNARLRPGWYVHEDARNLHPLELKREIEHHGKLIGWPSKAQQGPARPRLHHIYLGE
jgi:hypothetical protein